MKANSVRIGFANNSSSSHSILLGSPRKESLTERNGYGWEWFHLKKSASKRHYFAAQIFQALPSNISSDFKKIIVLDLTGIDISLNKEVPYIDHQSAWDLPRDFEGHCFDGEFLDEFFKFINRDDVTIRGGNDNDNGPDFKEKGRMNFPSDNQFRSLICRKDGDYFTLFNRDNGVKIRLTFNLDENGNPKRDYTFASAPELIDICLTHYCDYNCQFCTPADTKILTPSGNVNISDIKIGDKVYGFDLEDNKRKELTVEQIFERQYDGDLIEIEIEDGSVIKLTPDHEVFTSNRGWIKSSEIVENDEILKF